MSDDFEEARLYVASGNGTLSQATKTSFRVRGEILSNATSRGSAKNTQVFMKRRHSKIAIGVMDVIFHNHDIRNMRCQNGNAKKSLKRVGYLNVRQRRKNRLLWI